MKSKSYVPNDAKFFGSFHTFHPVRNQVYKLELLKKWSIYDVFHVLLLEYNITKKGWVDKTTSQLDFETDNKEKKYKIEQIWDDAIYPRELREHLLELYYQIFWKGYSEEENT